LLLGLTSVEEPAIWKMSSGIFLAAWISYVVISQYYYREVVSEAAHPTTRLTWVLLGGDGLSIVLLVVNVIGWPFPPSALIYCAAAVVWRLAGAALSFRMLLGEFWSNSNR
jgi:hypothetical protein